MEENQPSKALYSIQPVPGKGLGLIATAKIEKGARILSEYPLVQNSSPQHGKGGEKAKQQVNRSIVDQLSSLSLEDRDAFYALHNARSAEQDVNKYRELGIVQTNAVPLSQDSLEEAVFAQASRINHACNPNSQNTWNDKLGKLTVHATRDVAEGEEITISYLGEGFSARADRQRQLEKKFKFSCGCALCSLPEPQKKESDKRLLELQRLEKSIEESASTMSSPLQALRDVRQMMQVLEREGISDARALSVNKDALRIVAFQGDQARAKVFAERALAERITISGDDHPEVKKLKRLSENPSRHPAFGMSQMWSTTLEDLPTALDDGDFEAWLWQTESRGAPVETPPTSGFADSSTFPAFEDLPQEHTLDPRYFELDLSRGLVPIKHWCFLGQITHVEAFTRVRVIVKDRHGIKAVVAFYTWDDGVSMHERLVVGHTIAIMYAGVHHFLDGTAGMRLEEFKYVEILPGSLKQLLHLSDRIERFTTLQDGASLCHGCEQRKTTVKKCAKCSLFGYCGRDCQVIGWREKGHKEDCKLLGHWDMDRLLKLGEETGFEDYSLFE